MIARVQIYISCSVCGNELDADCVTIGEVIAHPCEFCKARERVRTLDDKNGRVGAGLRGVSDDPGGASGSDEGSP